MYRPFLTICSCCGKNITTYIKHEYNFLIVPLMLFLFYFYGFYYGIIIFLITFPLFKNITHSCPNCLTLLHEKYFFPITKKQNYISLKYGKCVIVLPMLCIYIVLSVIIVLGIYLNVQSGNDSNDNGVHKDKNPITFIDNLYEKDTNLTWEGLIKDCGAAVMVENSARGVEVFSRKYHKKVIQWKGYFLSAFVRHNMQHLVNLNIRMIPSESLRSQDLVLSMDYEKHIELYHKLKLLKTGTAIEFKASLEVVGNEWEPHHLHLVDFELIGDFVNEEEKVLLFKGVNFDLSGHVKIHKEIKKIMEIKSSSEGKDKEDGKEENDNKDGNEEEKEMDFRLDEDKEKDGEVKDNDSEEGKKEVEENNSKEDDKDNNEEDKENKNNEEKGDKDENNNSSNEENVSSNENENISNETKEDNNDNNNSNDSLETNNE